MTRKLLAAITITAFVLSILTATTFARKYDIPYPKHPVPPITIVRW